MDDDLRLETLRFTTAADGFDTEAVLQQALKAGFAFRDENRRGVVVVAGSATVRDKLQYDRRRFPEDGFPYTLLIEAGAEEVEVGPPYEDELVPLWQDFIAWLTRSYYCQVHNDFGVDLTDEVGRMCREMEHQ